MTFQFITFSYFPCVPLVVFSFTSVLLSLSILYGFGPLGSHPEGSRPSIEEQVFCVDTNAPLQLPRKPLGSSARWITR